MHRDHSTSSTRSCALGRACALLLLLTIGAHASAAQSSSDPATTKKAAALRKVWELDQEGLSPDAPRWVEALADARESVEKDGTPAERAYVDSAAAHMWVGACRWREALPFIDRAIESARVAGVADPVLWIDEIETRLQLGQFLHALEALRVHRRDLEQAADPETRASGHGMASRVYLLCGLPDLAAKSLAEFDRVAATLGPEYELDSLKRHANFARATFDFDKALVLTKRILEGAFDLGSSERARMLVLRGMAQLEMTRITGSLDPARITLQAAIAEAGIDMRTRFVAELQLVSLELRAQDTDAARLHLDEARASLALRTSALDDFVAPDDIAVFEAQCAQVALAQRAPPLELRAHKDRLDRAFEEQWKWFEAGPARSGGMGFLYYLTRRTVVSVLIQLEIALDPGDRGVEAALAVVLRAQRAGSATRAAQTDVDMASVRKALCQGGAGVVVILPVTGSSHVFLFDASPATHYFCAERRDLDADVRDLAELTLADSWAEHDAATDVAIASASSALTDHLLPPAARARLAGWKELYVVGAELLGNLPFESLRLDGDRELWMDVAISYLPSLPLGVWLARRADSRDAASQAARDPDATVVFVLEPQPRADADPSGPLPPLALDDETVQRITEPFDALRAHVFRASEATASCLSSVEVAHAPLLAMFVHGIYDLDHGERPAGLALTGGPDSTGVLWIEDVERLSVPPVVLLYTCESARGPLRMGDDAATHLGGAFFTAGADAVLVSGGQVSLRAAVALAPLLHERLAQGDSLAEAMRRARLMLKSDPQTAGLLRRLPLRVHGLGSRPPVGLSPAGGNGHVRSSTLAWILGALVAGAALSWLALARRRSAPTTIGAG